MSWISMSSHPGKDRAYPKAGYYPGVTVDIIHLVLYSLGFFLRGSVCCNLIP